MKKKQLFILLLCLLVIIGGLLSLIYFTSQPRIDYTNRDHFTKRNEDFLKKLNANPKHSVVVIINDQLSDDTQQIHLSNNPDENKIIFFNQTNKDQTVIITAPTDPDLFKAFSIGVHGSIAIPVSKKGIYNFNLKNDLKHFSAVEVVD